MGHLQRHPSWSQSWAGRCQPSLPPVSGLQHRTPRAVGTAVHVECTLKFYRVLTVLTRPRVSALSLLRQDAWLPAACSCVQTLQTQRPVLAVCFVRGHNRSMLVSYLPANGVRRPGETFQAVFDSGMCMYHLADGTPWPSLFQQSPCCRSVDLDTCMDCLRVLTSRDHTFSMSYACSPWRACVCRSRAVAQWHRHRPSLLVP